MKFNQGKCQVLPLGRNNPRHQNMAGAVWFRSIFAEKDEGVLVDTSFDRSQQSPYLQKKPSLGCMRKSVTSRSRKVTQPW